MFANRRSDPAIGLLDVNIDESDIPSTSSIEPDSPFFSGHHPSHEIFLPSTHMLGLFDRIEYYFELFKSSMINIRFSLTEISESLETSASYKVKGCGLPPSTNLFSPDSNSAANAIPRW